MVLSLCCCWLFLLLWDTNGGLPEEIFEKQLIFIDQKIIKTQHQKFIWHWYQLEHIIHLEHGQQLEHDQYNQHRLDKVTIVYTKSDPSNDLDLEIIIIFKVIYTTQFTRKSLHRIHSTPDKKVWAKIRVDQKWLIWHQQMAVL